MGESRDKKFTLALLIILAVLFIAVKCWSAPFLVSDVQIGVDTYTLVFNGSSPISSPAQKLSTGSRIHHDLQNLNLAAGPNIVTVTPCNMWTCGPTKTFSFNKVVPTDTTNIRIEAK